MSQPATGTGGFQTRPPQPTLGGEEAVRTSAASPPSLLSWLTVERAAYLGLALLALVLRLSNLGAFPLSDGEAEQALVAWRVYNGDLGVQPGYSPLIATLNLASFLLLGGSEFTARLGPALLGVALVLLPYGLRRYLGRGGVLTAAALFAISPTALYLSRTVNGDIGVAVGALALTVGLFGWLDWEPGWGSSRVAWLALAAAGLVLMLTASPSAYSALALLLGFLVLAAFVGERGYATSAREGLGALRTQMVGWGSFGLVLVVGLLAVATALLFNPGGLAATADLLTTWLLGFAPSTPVAGVFPAVFLLSLYELLILFAGLFGVSAALLRRRLFDLYLAWWFFGAVALNLLRSGRTHGEVLVPLVPLTLLAGMALGMLFDSLREDGSWQKEGIIAITGLIIGGYAYVSLMTYTRSGGLAFWLPLAGLGLFVALVALFWVWYDGPSALRGAALAAVALLLVFMVATSARLNNISTAPSMGGRVADPRQPMVRAPAAEGLPDLVATLKQLSSWRVGDPYLLSLVADRRLGPAVEWQLRHFTNATWVDGVDSRSPVIPALHSEDAPQETLQLGDFPVMLAPSDLTLALDEGYIGQDFAIRAFWSPAGLQGQSLIRWIVLRTATTPVDLERAVLWVEAPQAQQGEEEGIISGESID